MRRRLSGMGCAKRGAANGHSPWQAKRQSRPPGQAPSLRVAAKCGVCVVLAEAWSSVRATAKVSAGPRNRNPASLRPAPLHSFAGATLRGPSSCLSYGYAPSSRALQSSTLRQKRTPRRTLSEVPYSGVNFNRFKNNSFQAPSILKSYCRV